MTASIIDGKAHAAVLKAKIAAVTAIGSASATAIAAPMNGAVHGVATTAASRPGAKLPSHPPRAATLWPTPANRPLIWNTPDKFRPIANSSQAITATNTGDWN